MPHLEIHRVWIRSGFQKKASCRVQAIRSSLAHGRRLEPNVATLQINLWQPGSPSSCNAVKLSLPLTLLTACQTANRKNYNSVLQSNCQRFKERTLNSQSCVDTGAVVQQNLDVTWSLPQHTTWSLFISPPLYAPRGSLQEQWHTVDILKYKGIKIKKLHQIYRRPNSQKREPC